MKPGRELDRLVSDEVMGEDFSEWRWLGEKVLMAGIDPRVRTPHYSTSIKAAWKVVENMYQGHWAIEYDPITLDWHVTMGPHDVVADTAPLAICLAALKAVGADIPEET